MRILFLTERFPFPLHDGGNLRTYHILRGLAKRHEVWLLSHRGVHDASCLRHLCHAETIAKPRVVARFAWNSLRRGMRKYPLFVLKNWSDRLLRAADSLLARQHFDAIHFNHLDTACYCLARDWPQLKVFDSHNCLSTMATRSSRNGSARLARMVFSREARKLRQIERAVCRRVDLTFVCSTSDQEAFASLQPEGSYVVVPNGVDIEYYRPSTRIVPEPGCLVFTGAMDYFPNEQAVLFFCREVLPMLRDCRPSPRFFVVGKNPPARVRSLHDGTSVIVTGQVDDVRPYVLRASAFVVPLRHGGGTRLKILEAFAMAKAVVSTSLGIEGIPATNEREFLVADDPRSFARQVCRVLTSADLRTRLGTAGNRLVRQEFDWQYLHTGLLAAYERCQRASQSVRQDKPNQEQQ